MSVVVSVEELLTLIEEIEQQKGKYIKATLTTLEKEKISPTQRKAVLDGFNNFARQVYARLGYKVEE